MEITAAVSREKGQPLSLEKLQLESPRADEVLVRIVGVGVCHTDIGVRNQDFPAPQPIVLGHEGAGIVTEVGSAVTLVKPGDHVVLCWLNCGVCPNCRQGHPANCIKLFDFMFAGTRPDGSSSLRTADGALVHGHFFSQSSFATYALATERNVVKVRDDVPIELLGPLGCGVATGAGVIMNTLQPHAGSSVAVFGAGAVGLSAVLAAKAVGCTTIIAVDIQPNRLDLARELGATHVINGKEADAVAAIKEIVPGGVEYSIEAVGSPALLRQAMDALAIRGTCALVGVAPYGRDVQVEMAALLPGRRLVGVMEGDSVPQVFIPQLVDLYVAGRFPFDKLVRYYPFEQINQAIEDSEKGTTIKAVLLLPT